MLNISYFFFECSGALQDLHVLTHSCPTRRSSELHAVGKVRGALGDQAQRHAIFTAFLGNPFENLARRLPGADVLRRNVAMRLLADEQDRALRLAARPYRIVEGQARQHRDDDAGDIRRRSEEHTSELQSLMRISYAVFCLKKKKQKNAQPATKQRKEK